MFDFKVNPILYPNPADLTANCCLDPVYNPTANCCNINNVERYDYLLSQMMQACCNPGQSINENDTFQKAADDFFAYRNKISEDKKAEEAQREHSDVAGEYKIAYVQEDD